MFISSYTVLYLFSITKINRTLKGVWNVSRTSFLLCLYNCSYAIVNTLCFYLIYCTFIRSTLKWKIRRNQMANEPRKSKDRQYNTMDNSKRTQNNYLQNTTQNKSKYWAKLTPQKLRCSRWAGLSCYTSCTRHVTVKRNEYHLQ